MDTNSVLPPPGPLEGSRHWLLTILPLHSPLTCTMGTIKFASFSFWQAFAVWFRVQHLVSQSFDGPQLWRSMSVCSSLYLITRAHCTRCCPLIPLWLASHLLAPAGRRTQSPDSALRVPLSHDRQRACLFFLLVHQLFELGLQVAFNNRSAVTHHKVLIRVCPNFYFRAAALSAPMMLLCCSFAPACFPLGTPRLCLSPVKF